MAGVYYVYSSGRKYSSIIMLPSGVRMKDWGGGGGGGGWYRAEN